MTQPNRDDSYSHDTGNQVRSETMPKCPKCGAFARSMDGQNAVAWFCGSGMIPIEKGDRMFVQSDRCKIYDLERRLAESEIDYLGQIGRLIQDRDSAIQRAEAADKKLAERDTQHPWNVFRERDQLQESLNNSIAEERRLRELHQQEFSRAELAAELRAGAEREACAVICSHRGNELNARSHFANGTDSEVCHDLNRERAEEAWFLARLIREREPIECQPLLDELRRLRKTVKWYSSRCEMIQELQTHIPDPYRTVICNVLANGSFDVMGRTAADAINSLDASEAKL